MRCLIFKRLDLHTLEKAGEERFNIKDKGE
jgi:hypothetical protein